MDMSMNRRNFLLAAVAGTALSACVETTVGSTKTVTLDTVKVVNYAQAGINAASMVVAIIAVVTPTAPVIPDLESYIEKLKLSLETFKALAGTSPTFTYDTASIGAETIESMLAAVSHVATLVSAIAGQYVDPDTVGRIRVIASSIATIATIFEAAVHPSIMTASGTLGEKQALANLAVK